MGLLQSSKRALELIWGIPGTRGHFEMISINSWGVITNCGEYFQARDLTWTFQTLWCILLLVVLRTKYDQRVQSFSVHLELFSGHWDKKNSTGYKAMTHASFGVSKERILQLLDGGSLLSLHGSEVSVHGQDYFIILLRGHRKQCHLHREAKKGLQQLHLAPIVPEIFWNWEHTLNPGTVFLLFRKFGKLCVPLNVCCLKMSGYVGYT